MYKKFICCVSLLARCGVLRRCSSEVSTSGTLGTAISAIGTRDSQEYRPVPPHRAEPRASNTARGYLVIWSTRVAPRYFSPGSVGWATCWRAIPDWAFGLGSASPCCWDYWAPGFWLGFFDF